VREPHGLVDEEPDRVFEGSVNIVVELQLVRRVFEERHPACTTSKLRSGNRVAAVEMSWTPTTVLGPTPTGCALWKATVLTPSSWAFSKRG
jgi:hypothetical protein